MAHRAPHLKHLHVTGAFYSWWEADQQIGAIGGEALHSVAGCLNAFPSWMEVKVSSLRDIRFIRFIRRNAGIELSQNFDGSVWLGTFAEYDIEIKGWNLGFSS